MINFLKKHKNVFIGLFLVLFIFSLFILIIYFENKDRVNVKKTVLSDINLVEDSNNLYKNVEYSNSSISWNWVSYIPQVVSTMSEYIVYYEDNGEYDYALDVSDVNGLFDVYQKNGIYYCGLNFNKMPNKFRNTNNHLQINISNNWYDVNSIDIDVYDGLKFNLADSYIWDIYLNCVVDVYFFDIFNNCDFGFGSADLENVHYFYNDYGDNFVMSRVIGRDRYFFEFYLYSNHSNSSSYIYNLDYTFINGMYGDLFTFDKFNFSNNTFENQDIFYTMMDYNSWFNSYYVNNLNNQITNLNNQITNLNNQVQQLQFDNDALSALSSNNNLLLNYIKADFYYNNDIVASTDTLQSLYDPNYNITFLDLVDSSISSDIQLVDYVDLYLNNTTIVDVALFYNMFPLGSRHCKYEFFDNYNRLVYTIDYSDFNGPEFEMPLPIESNFTFNRIRCYNLLSNKYYGIGAYFSLGLSDNDNAKDYYLGYTEGLKDSNDTIDSLNSQVVSLSSQVETLQYQLDVANENAQNQLNGLTYTMISAIMSTPFNILHDMLNFNFFGINVFSLFTSLITLLLLIWVIKFLIGRK